MVAIADTVVVLGSAPWAEYQIQFRAGEKIIHACCVVAAPASQFTQKTIVCEAKIVAAQPGNSAEPVIPMNMILGIEPYAALCYLVFAALVNHSMVALNAAALNGAEKPVSNAVVLYLDAEGIDGFFS